MPQPSSVLGSRTSLGQTGNAQHMPMQPSALVSGSCQHRLGSLSPAPTPAPLPRSGAPHMQLWKLWSGCLCSGSEEEIEAQGPPLPLGRAAQGNPRAVLGES